jgi:hypothetical protein
MIMVRRFDKLLFAFLTVATLALTVLCAGFSARADGDESRYSWNDMRSKIDVRIKGEIEFTSDDSDVSRLSPDGYLEIDERRGGTRHELTIEPDGAGGLEHTYRRNRRAQPWDAEARQWLARTLPRVIRESGIGAEARVERILGDHGVDGVLVEIDLIGSSRSTRIYCTALLEQGDLDDGELQRLVRVAADGIASSGERARFLISAANHYQDGAAVEAYYDATRSIPSSGDHARVLIRVIEGDLAGEPRQLALLLGSARGIASSGDKARVLIAATDVWVDDDAVRRAYFEAADSIPSSGDHARVLLAMIQRGELGSRDVIALLESVRGIASSGEKARVLVATADRVHDDATVDAYLAAAESIPSSGDQKRALSALIRHASAESASSN